MALQVRRHTGVPRLLRKMNSQLPRKLFHTQIKVIKNLWRSNVARQRTSDSSEKSKIFWLHCTEGLKIPGPPQHEGRATKSWIMSLGGEIPNKIGRSVQQVHLLRAASTQLYQVKYKTHTAIYWKVHESCPNRRCVANWVLEIVQDLINQNLF